MKNIFENAYFGMQYKTRDGRKALYAGKDFAGEHTCIVEGIEMSFQIARYYPNGEWSEFNHTGINNCDIVSEWQEEINEEELDRLTKQELKSIMPTDYGDGYNQIIEYAYKAGYRKAKENK